MARQQQNEPREQNLHVDDELKYSSWHHRLCCLVCKESFNQKALWGRSSTMRRVQSRREQSQQNLFIIFKVFSMINRRRWAFGLVYNSTCTRNNRFNLCDINIYEFPLIESRARYLHSSSHKFRLLCVNLNFTFFIFRPSKARVYQQRPSLFFGVKCWRIS